MIYALGVWAKNNPEIWGNKKGYLSMFSSKHAYNYPRFDGVIKHWEEVRDRIKDKDYLSKIGKTERLVNSNTANKNLVKI